MIRQVESFVADQVREGGEDLLVGKAPVAPKKTNASERSPESAAHRPLGRAPACP